MDRPSRDLIFCNAMSWISSWTENSNLWSALLNTAAFGFRASTCVHTIIISCLLRILWTLASYCLCNFLKNTQCYVTVKYNLTIIRQKAQQLQCYWELWKFPALSHTSCVIQSRLPVSVTASILNLSCLVTAMSHARKLWRPSSRYLPVLISNQNEDWLKIPPSLVNGKSVPYKRNFWALLHAY